MFGFNKMKKNDIEEEAREIVNKIINLYLKNNNMTFNNLSELERQIICNYSFGVINGINLTKYNQKPDEVAKCTTKILVSIYNYSTEQANSFVETMISDIQSNDYTSNTSNVIIHRGLEGYLNNKDNEDLIVEDLTNIIEIVKKHSNNGES